MMRVSGSSRSNRSNGSNGSRRSSSLSNSYESSAGLIDDGEINKQQTNGAGGEGTGKSSNVRVVVRCRPLNNDEMSRNEKSVVAIDDNNVVRLRIGNTEKTYKFNKAVGADCTQGDLFRESGVTALLDSALDGYAATMFAYGQTGSGKTYSMSGLEEQISQSEYRGGAASDGIIPRSIAYIFESIASNRNATFNVKASFCEIYNEQVYDLLNFSNQSLQVRYNSKKGFYVQDLVLCECTNLGDVLEVVTEGHRNRSVGSHELNKDSSRSHSILTLEIQSEAVDPDDGHTFLKYGKLRFVDLAGSERLKETKSSGQALAETGAINKSLFTLANVISALSGGGNGGTNQLSHVPYRDSKLTKLLMDSLGGNSLTLMICCCSPAASYSDETLQTLNYASRASRIKNRPSVRMDEKDRLIARLRQEIKRLKMENEFLRGSGGNKMIGNYNGGPGSNHDTMSQHGNGLAPNRGTLDQMKTLPNIASGQHEDQGLLPPGLSNLSGPKAPSAKSPSGRLSPRTKAGTLPIGFTNQALGGAAVNGGPSVDAILSNYQQEIQRLETESKDIRMAAIISERNFHNAMVENEILQTKLQHLEEIFVHNNEPEKKSSDDDSKVIGDDDQFLKSENHRLMQQVHQFKQILETQEREEPVVIKGLKKQNVHLQQVIQELKRRESSLLRALSAQQHQPIILNNAEQHQQEHPSFNQNNFRRHSLDAHKNVY